MSTPFHGYWKNLALAITNSLDGHWHPLRDFGHVKFFSKKTLIPLVCEVGFSVKDLVRVGRISALARSMISSSRLNHYDFRSHSCTKTNSRICPAAWNRLRWSDDIHVYDSFSTDRTLEIARAAGAHITQRHFDDWSAHQNWGLANIPFRYSWVLYLDADERVTLELAGNILQAAENPGDKVAFRVKRRDFWGERWLKHAVASSYYIAPVSPGEDALRTPGQSRFHSGRAGG